MERKRHATRIASPSTAKQTISTHSAAWLLARAADDEGIYSALPQIPAYALLKPTTLLRGSSVCFATPRRNAPRRTQGCLRTAHSSPTPPRVLGSLTHKRATPENTKGFGTGRSEENTVGNVPPISQGIPKNYTATLFYISGIEGTRKI
jgi:hypothetical protein